MKRIILIINFICMGLLYSCDDFVELDPISSIGSDNFYKSAQDVETAVIACYDGLQQEVTNITALTEIRSDNATNRLGTGDIGFIDHFSDDEFNSFTTEYWQGTYNTISRVHLVTANLEIIEESGVKNQFEGEARFIRAYSYFNLVRLFGDVPLVTSKITPADFAEFRNDPVNNIYNQIIEDLEFAATNLPLNYEGTDRGRATSGAAKSLLAKVHATLGNRSTAIAYLEEVIASNQYDLVDDYSDVFSEENELNEEIIFTIQFQSNANGEGQDFSFEFTNLGGLGGIDIPTENLKEAYEPGDLRRAVSIDEAENVNIKYKSNASRGDSGNDWPIIRYADVLLLYAELVNEESGPVSASFDNLNLVRERAGLSDLDITDLPTKEALRAAVAKERRLELAFENHRWFDLLRTEKAIEVMTAHGTDEGFAVADFRLLFPIPQREIDVSQGALSQNSGY